MTKTILITGAGTGIGRDSAFAPAACGHRVIATTFDEAHAQTLRAEMDQLGKNVQVALIEAKSTRSIQAQIVKASEASRPKTRYVAPWIQGAVVRLAGIFGA